MKRTPDQSPNVSLQEPLGQQLWAAFDFPRHPLAREDGERVCGAYFEPPARWLRAHRAEEVAAVLDAAHQASRDGAWVLGGLRYEAAAAFDSAISVHASLLPLAEFAVYEAAPLSWPAAVAFEGPLTSDWQDVQSEPAEAAQIERIREWIRAGDCYQVNLTTRLKAELRANEPDKSPPADLAALFLALHAAQPGGFSLFLREAGVASVSPELFFDWRPLAGADKTWLLAAQPMKGTAARGSDAAADEAAQAYLRTSEKERAENLMIVDLLRNDISRVATLGSVRVPRLFELLALPTVWQMTSTVTAVSRPRLRLSELFTALFPCGSVTGAPKLRAMQIIRALEPQARGWYCGALGVLQPGGAATFNVPIRTVEADMPAAGAGHAATLCLTAGVGSAITLDSVAAAELAEWRAKTRYLLRAQAPIAALETLRLEDGLWLRLPAHLARLQRTAQHFGLKCPLAEVRQALREVAAAHPAGAWRLRLTVDALGRVQTLLLPLPQTPAVVLLALADEAIETDGSAAEFIQHKTTRREVYDYFAQRKPAAAFDVLLWNRREELTECSFGNIALQIDGQWLTPRREAGLLPGVFRDELLQSRRVQEARLLKTDLGRAQALAFINSLRGWCPAALLAGPATDLG
jgi:para-aminobenzoate synthetase/4-amino-4-deoxychorismate lyase